jgi:hypothetical protein
MSAALSHRMAVARIRAVESLRAANGLDAIQYRMAALSAYQAWLAGRPWRWLPPFVGSIAFRMFGTRYVVRFATEWARDANG